MAGFPRGTPEYRRHERLGAGGMGEVYLGTMVGPAGQKRVAFKQLAAGKALGPETTERIVAEARLVFQLNHANICQVLDLGANDEGTFIVMEYVDGVDLKTLLDRLSGGLPSACALHIAREVARALDYAHRRTDDAGQALLLVHGDVTPQNILLSQEGEVKLADFGIARAMGTAAPGNALRAGTPGFVPPEAYTAAASQSADIYALGVTLYVALGGSLARGLHIEEVCQRCTEVGGDLAPILYRATAAKREDRYLTADDFEQALGVLLARRFPEFRRSLLADLVRKNRVAAPQEAQPRLPDLVSLTHASTVTRIEHHLSSPGDPAGPPRRTQTSIRDSESPRRPGRTVRLAVGGVLAMLAIVGTLAARAWLAARPTPAAATSFAAPSIPSPTPAPPAPPTEVATISRPAAAAPSPKPRRPSVLKTGYLSVSSEPWGAVIVDGKQLAAWTPAYRLPLPAGKHSVKIYNDKRKQYSPPREVTIREGDTQVIGFQW